MSVGGATPAFVESLLDPSSPLFWVLFGLLLYWAGIVSLRRRNLLPSYVGAQGPILTIHTTRGRAFLDRLSGPKRFWRAVANVGVGISVVVMASMFTFLALSAFASLTAPQPSAVHQPRNVLVIPGVNDFLPLSATPGIVFGLLVGLVVHEGGHGLLCRVEDIDIESMGVAMLAVLPIGAFVEPDHESSKAASRGGQTRMFAAGVTFNFAVTLLALALLFGPVAGAISVAPGASIGGVDPGTPAADGIEAGDRITAVDGEPIETNEDLEAFLSETESETVEVVVNGDDDDPVSLERALLVSAAVERGSTTIEHGETIVGVDGEDVSTEPEFRDALDGTEVTTLSIEDDGDVREEEMPVGAFVTVADDGPLVDAGADAGEPMVVTEIAGERVVDFADLEAVLGSAEPGEEVPVRGYGTAGGENVSADDEAIVEYDVTLDAHPEEESAFLGIQGAEGVSGITVNDLGVELYPAEEFLAILGGDEEGSFAWATDSFLGKAVFMIFLPIVGIVEVLPYNFAGFAGGVENFYQANGSLAVLGEWPVFAAANLLFWTAWINVNLAFFNCIPAFPLDGGHILRSTTEAVISRIPTETTRGMVRTVTTTVGVTMLLSLLALVFGPMLLAG